MTRPGFVSDDELKVVLAELREYADGGRAVSRAAAGRAVVELEGGHTIRDGRHVYVSTYCQHAADLEALGPQLDEVAGELHAACRRTCKTCHAPCLCDAPGCPCREARNRSNVYPENPTHVQEDDMAPKEPVNGDDDRRDDYPTPPPQEVVSEGSPPPRNPPPETDG